MDNNKIILILSIILVVMIVAIFFAFSFNFAKQDSKVVITSESSLYSENSITIHLTDLNGNPIANQVVNITLLSDGGGERNYQVRTDTNGDASLQLNDIESGYYTVNVNYGGNDNFAGCNATQNLEIKEAAVQSSSSSSSSGDGNHIVYDSEDTLHMEDANGNPIPGSGSNYYISSSGQVVFTGQGD